MDLDKELLEEAATSPLEDAALSQREPLRVPDEELPCDVCRDGYWDDDNAILICDGVCNRAVHQTCYGVLAIPAGEWLCDSCREGFSGECFLCRLSGGIMRQTKNGEWAHVLCALTLPGTSFGNATCMAPIVVDDPHKVEAARKGARCYLCAAGRSGCVLRCCATGCRKSFHSVCGANAGFRLELRAGTALTPHYCGDHQDALKAALKRDDGFCVDDVIGLMDGAGVCNPPPPLDDGEAGAAEGGGSGAAPPINAATAGKMPSRDGMVLRRAMLPDALVPGTDRQVGAGQSDDGCAMTDGFATARCAVAAWRAAVLRHDAAVAAVCKWRGVEYRFGAPSEGLPAEAAGDAVATSLFGTNNQRWKHAARYLDGSGTRSWAELLEGAFGAANIVVEEASRAVGERGGSEASAACSTDCAWSSVHIVAEQSTVAAATARFSFAVGGFDQATSAAGATSFEALRTAQQAAAWWRESVMCGCPVFVVRVSLPKDASVRSSESNRAGNEDPAIELLVAADDEDDELCERIADSLAGRLHDEQPACSDELPQAGVARALRRATAQASVVLVEGASALSSLHRAGTARARTLVGVPSTEIESELWVLQRALDRLQGTVTRGCAELQHKLFVRLEKDVVSLRHEAELLAWTALYCVIYGPCSVCRPGTARADAAQQRQLALGRPPACTHAAARRRKLRIAAQGALKHPSMIAASSAAAASPTLPGAKDQSAGASAASALARDALRWRLMWAPPDSAEDAFQTDDNNAQAPFPFPRHLAATVLSLLDVADAATSSSGGPPLQPRVVSRPRNRSSLAAENGAAPNAPPSRRRGAAASKAAAAAAATPQPKSPFPELAGLVISDEAETWMRNYAAWLSERRAGHLAAARAGAIRALSDASAAADAATSKGLGFLGSAAWRRVTAAKIICGLAHSASFTMRRAITAAGSEVSALTYPLVLGPKAGSMTSGIVATQAMGLGVFRSTGSVVPTPAPIVPNGFVRRLRALRLSESSAVVSSALPVTAIEAHLTRPLRVADLLSPMPQVNFAVGAFYEVSLAMDYMLLRLETADLQVRSLHAASNTEIASLATATGRRPEFLATLFRNITVERILAAEPTATAAVATLRVLSPAPLLATHFDDATDSAASSWRISVPDSVKATQGYLTTSDLLASGEVLFRLAGRCAVGMPRFGHQTDDVAMAGICESLEWLQNEIVEVATRGPQRDDFVSIFGEEFEDGALSEVQRCMQDLPQRFRRKLISDNGDELFCVCKTAHSEAAFYIGCDYCGDWMHTSCVGLSPFQATFVVLAYACEACALEWRRETLVRSMDDPMLLAADVALRIAPLTKSQRRVLTGDPARLRYALVSSDPWAGIRRVPWASLRFLRLRLRDVSDDARELVLDLHPRAAQTAETVPPVAGIRVRLTKILDGFGNVLGYVVAGHRKQHDVTTAARAAAAAAASRHNTSQSTGELIQSRMGPQHSMPQVHAAAAALLRPATQHSLIAADAATAQISFSGRADVIYPSAQQLPGAASAVDPEAASLSAERLRDLFLQQRAAAGHVQVQVAQGHGLWHHQVEQRQAWQQQQQQHVWQQQLQQQHQQRIWQQQHQHQLHQQQVQQQEAWLQQQQLLQQQSEELDRQLRVLHTPALALEPPLWQPAVLEPSSAARAFFDDAGVPRLSTALPAFHLPEAAAHSAALHQWPALHDPPAASGDPPEAVAQQQQQLPRMSFSLTSADKSPPAHQ